MKNTIHHGDCLEIMKLIPNGSVDMILCDLPYGTTACKWDTIIPFEALWEQYKRVIKDNGAIVLTAAQPFTSALILSNTKMFKYSLVWQKSTISHFAQAPYRFLTEHEDIVIFSFGGCSSNANPRMKFNPQGLIDCNKLVKGKGHSDHRPSKKIQKPFFQTKTGYPKSVLKFNSDKAKHHPTQKPVALFEYLIKTYTNEGDTVLDNCAGSGTTGVACQNTNRNYILIEQEQKYYDIIVNRLGVGHEFSDNLIF